MGKTTSMQEIVSLAKKLATPIDFGKLEREGIIEKSGSWFRVVKGLKALPEHAHKQIKSIRTDGKGNCFVQFPKSWKQAQQRYLRFTGMDYNE